MSKISLVLLLVLIIGAGIITASTSPEGQPFEAIWEAIQNLQDQVDDIEQQTGTGLKVVDAEGTEVGYLIDHQVDRLRVFDKNLSLFLNYDLQGSFSGDIDYSNVAYFTTTDCTGIPYFYYYDPYLLFLLTQNGGETSTLYRGVGSPESVELNSIYNSDRCELTGGLSVMGMRLEEFTPPTYVGPLMVVEG